MTDTVEMSYVTDQPLMVFGVHSLAIDRRQTLAKP